LTAILFVGDVVGSAGRRAIRTVLGDLRAELQADFVVVNGENAAGGIGITPKHADELFKAGADVITLGNHTYRHREVWPYLEERRDIIRPANFLPTQPGRGTAMVEHDGVTLGVVNLAGNLYMNQAAPALLVADEALKEVARADHVLVDMHAEATSEKVALGWHLDGKVTAVVGTHTHVPTADARVLPGGTAYITDLGMTGPTDGVIGVDRDIILQRFLSQMPVRFEPAKGPAALHAVLIVIDPETGRATDIRRLRVPA
jgi:2',3'-cyclic-nucleotide 2'-phosphodiesterase